MKLKAYLQQMTKEELVELALYMGSWAFGGARELAQRAYSVRWEAATHKQRQSWERYETASKAWLERQTEIVPLFNESRDLDLKLQLAKEMTDRSAEVRRLWEANLRVEAEATKIYNQGPPKVDR